MLRLAPCVLVAAALLAAPTARAGDFDRFGFYVGVGGSYSKNLFENEIEDVFEDELDDADDLDIDIEDSFGVNGRAGVRLLPFLAVEAQYEWIRQYDIEIGATTASPAATGVAPLEFETHTLTGNLKLLAPLWRVHPYVLAGVGFQKFELEGDAVSTVPAVGTVARIEEDGLALAGRVGAGLDVYLTEHVLLNAEVSGVLTDEKVTIQIPGIVDESVQGLHYFAAGVGLQYRF